MSKVTYHQKAISRSVEHDIIAASMSPPASRLRRQFTLTTAVVLAATVALSCAMDGPTRDLDGASSEQGTTVTSSSEPGGTTKSSASVGAGPIDRDGGDNRGESAVQPDDAADPGVDPATPDLGVMPELVGMTESEAREHLAAKGLDDVQIVDQQEIGTAGEVLRQQPKAGNDAAGTVTLTVRTEVPLLPDYAGRQERDAVAELEQWGVQVIINEKVDETRPEGEVLGSVPAAESKIGQQVELTVAARPVTLYLSDDDAPLIDIFLGEQYSRWSDSAVANRDRPSVSVDGTMYSKSVWIQYDWREDLDERVGQPLDSVVPSQMDFDLSRDWSIFRATAGVGDSSQSPVRAIFRIIVDGQTLDEHTIALGTPVDLDIPVENALRLRLEVEPLIAGRGVYVWGDARLVGAGSSG